MARPDGIGAPQALEVLVPPLVQRAVAWRTGERVAPGLEELRAELPREALTRLEGAVQGDEPLAPPTAAVARRAWALLRHASAVDALCGEWSRASVMLPDAGGPEEVRVRALYTATPGMAVALWDAARQPLHSLVRDPGAELAETFHDPQAPRPAVDQAKAFLEATVDVWRDASAHAERWGAHVRDLPDTLRHAQAMEAPALTGLVSSFACRHLARELVRGLLDGNGELRRYTVRPLGWLPGFPVLLADGVPRVGWHERPGVVALVDLVGNTVSACALARMGREPDETVAATVARVVLLGLLPPSVLRRSLGLTRADADRLRRQVGTVLLRQARVAAALAVAQPVVPDDARDALADATRSDPDVLEAAALLLPWPPTVPTLGPLGPELAARWSAWQDAGILALAAREAWDEDFVRREITAQALREALAGRVGSGGNKSTALMEALGAAPGDGRALAECFAQSLG